ncbi:glycosyl transferase [Frigidibacter sp. MR17.24]|uniref:glycosyl transferase n=1 Tax=Frigidibacter sp. MR17.24 TaxID=3127345 RepID=UPI003012F2B4
MADFHQGGSIATLHMLDRGNARHLSRELEVFAARRPVTLILPSLYSELEGEALPRILDELSGVTWLKRIVIGLDQADAGQYRAARAFFARLPQDHVVLWNDSPRMQGIAARLVLHELGPVEPGKGRNVWTAIGYTLARADTAVVAFHDCDITTYDRDLLARLVYPVANPNFPYQLSKGYYPRIGGGKLNGRVARLLVSPLLIALRRVIGDRDYIDYLRAFRYPLSGEFAIAAHALADLRIPSDWGLEIGVLSEAWRNMAPRAVAQVELTDAYDHKHQALSEHDASTGLSRMSVDICKALYRKLAADGTVFSEEIFRTLRATYYRTALDLLDSYYSDAMMNGLTLDRHAEERAIELFARNVVEAGRVYLEFPAATPFIPTWNRVHAADPQLMRDMLAAVAADAEEFT